MEWVEREDKNPLSPNPGHGIRCQIFVYEYYMWLLRQRVNAKQILQTQHEILPPRSTAAGVAVPALADTATVIIWIM